MRKFEAVRQAQDCVTTLTEGKKGVWMVRFRKDIGSPWEIYQGFNRLEVMLFRRDKLIRHARRLLGKPEDYDNSRKEWALNI